MGHCCCQRSVPRIRRSILLPRDLSRPPGKLPPTPTLSSDLPTREATPTPSRSLSCLSKTTSHPTLVQCPRCAPQSHSLNKPPRRDELQVSVSIAKAWASMASQPTASCPPTFLQLPTPRPRPSWHRTSTTLLNGPRHHFIRISSWTTWQSAPLTTVQPQP